MTPSVQLLTNSHDLYMNNEQNSSRKGNKNVESFHDENDILLNAKRLSEAIEYNAQEILSTGVDLYTAVAIGLLNYVDTNERYRHRICYHMGLDLLMLNPDTRVNLLQENLRYNCIVTKHHNSKSTGLSKDSKINEKNELQNLPFGAILQALSEFINLNIKLICHLNYDGLTFHCKHEQEIKPLYLAYNDTQKQFMAIGNSVQSIQSNLLNQMNQLILNTSMFEGIIRPRFYSTLPIFGAVSYSMRASLSQSPLLTKYSSYSESASPFLNDELAVYLQEQVYLQIKLNYDYYEGIRKNKSDINKLDNRFTANTLLSKLSLLEQCEQLRQINYYSVDIEPVVFQVLADIIQCAIVILYSDVKYECPDILNIYIPGQPHLQLFQNQLNGYAEMICIAKNEGNQHFDEVTIAIGSAGWQFIQTKIIYMLNSQFALSQYSDQQKFAVVNVDENSKEESFKSGSNMSPSNPWSRFTNVKSQKPDQLIVNKHNQKSKNLKSKRQDQATNQQFPEDTNAVDGPKKVDIKNRFIKTKEKIMNVFGKIKDTQSNLGILAPIYSPHEIDEIGKSQRELGDKATNAMINFENKIPLSISNPIAAATAPPLNEMATLDGLNTKPKNIQQYPNRITSAPSFKKKKDVLRLKSRVAKPDNLKRQQSNLSKMNSIKQSEPDLNRSENRNPNISSAISALTIESNPNVSKGNENNLHLNKNRLSNTITTNSITTNAMGKSVDYQNMISNSNRNIYPTGFDKVDSLTDASSGSTAESAAYFSVPIQMQSSSTTPTHNNTTISINRINTSTVDHGLHDLNLQNEQLQKIGVNRNTSNESFLNEIVDKPSHQQDLHINSALLMKLLLNKEISSVDREILRRALWEKALTDNEKDQVKYLMDKLSNPIDNLSNEDLAESKNQLYDQDLIHESKQYSQNKNNALPENTLFENLSKMNCELMADSNPNSLTDNPDVDCENKQMNIVGIHNENRTTRPKESSDNKHQNKTKDKTPDSTNCNLTLLKMNSSITASVPDLQAAQENTASVQYDRQSNGCFYAIARSIIIAAHNNRNAETYLHNRLRLGTISLNGEINNEQTTVHVLNRLHKLCIREWKRNKNRYDTYMNDVDFEKEISRFRETGQCCPQLENAVPLSIANSIGVEIQIITSLREYPILQITPDKLLTSKRDMVVLLLAFDQCDGPFGKYSVAVSKDSYIGNAIRKPNKTVTFSDTPEVRTFERSDAEQAELHEWHMERSRARREKAASANMTSINSIDGITQFDKFPSLFGNIVNVPFGHYPIVPMGRHYHQPHHQAVNNQIPSFPQMNSMGQPFLNNSHLLHSNNQNSNMQNRHPFMFPIGGYIPNPVAYLPLMTDDTKNNRSKLTNNNGSQRSQRSN